MLFDPKISSKHVANQLKRIPRIARIKHLPAETERICADYLLDLNDCTTRSLERKQIRYAERYHIAKTQHQRDEAFVSYQLTRFRLLQLRADKPLSQDDVDFLQEVYEQYEIIRTLYHSSATALKTGHMRDSADYHNYERKFLSYFTFESTHKVRGTSLLVHLPFGHTPDNIFYECYPKVEKKHDKYTIYHGRVLSIEQCFNIVAAVVRRPYSNAELLNELTSLPVENPNSTQTLQCIRNLYKAQTLGHHPSRTVASGDLENLSTYENQYVGVPLNVHHQNTRRKSYHAGNPSQTTKHFEGKENSSYNRDGNSSMNGNDNTSLEKFVKHNDHANHLSNELFVLGYLVVTLSRALFEWWRVRRR